MAKTTELTEEVKGSRFIAWVSAVKEVGEVDGLLTLVRNRYPDASHHCFAYKLGDTVKFSDDGEPGGTAGRPMLELFNKRDLDYVVGVVTRYFGGTKLGAGGLVRAYSGSLAKALDAAGVVEVKDRTVLELAVPFADMDTVHRLLDDWAELSKGEPAYTAEGSQLEVELLEEDVEKFRETLTSLTRGAATVEKGESEG